VTSQGHPARVFRQAIERGDLLAAESVVRELGGVSLADALELAAMIALRDAGRGRRAGARWLQRWLDETDAVTIDECCLVATCLAALGGPRHLPALAALRGIAQR
jgi:hypothetical protein